VLFAFLALVYSEEYIKEFGEMPVVEYCGPNCHNEFGAVYQKNKQGQPGCTYIHYNRYAPPNGAIQFVNNNSPICADSTAAPQGNPVVAYNRQTKISYFATGRGATVWQIQSNTGSQAPFAPIPVRVPPLVVIGLEYTCGKVYLITLKEIFVATPQPFGQTTTFASLWLFPLAPPLTTNSRVDSNKELLYINGLPRNIMTFNLTDGTSFSVPATPLLAGPIQQLFWAPALAAAVVAKNDQLWALEPPNGMFRLLADLLPNSGAATTYGNFYYTSNSTKFLTLNMITLAAQLTNIAGDPVLGNYVYFA
jgi:hypothetical protein